MVQHVPLRIPAKNAALIISIESMLMAVVPMK